MNIGADFIAPEHPMGQHEMPWMPEDAPRHTHKADTDARRRMRSDVANKVLKDTGDEGRAVRTAHDVVARNAKKSLAARLSWLIWRK